MTRLFWVLRVTVKDGERAILTRDGRFERVLGPGRHRMFDPTRSLTAEVVNVVNGEITAERYAGLASAQPALASEHFTVVETGAGEVAIVKLDGRPIHLLGPWAKRVFWTAVTRVEVERIDVAAEPR